MQIENSMEMILFEEKDLLEIVRNTLEKFDDANLESEAAREAISQKVLKGVKAESEEIDGEDFLSGHKN